MNVLLLATEADDPPNPILPEWNDMFWGALCFGILYLLFKLVLLPPIQRGRAQREQRLRALRDAAERASSEAGSVVGDYEAQLVDSRAEAAQIIDAVRAEVETERAEMVGAAETEIAAKREAAAAALASAREAAFGDLRPVVTDLAVGAASRVMGRDIDAGAAASAVSQYIDSNAAG
ncbi:MAG: hypothetical protein GY713_06895 [Actinomycetia bacterium]|nr:hypothetical protein [Actinomycetes bacterium]